MSDSTLTRNYVKQMREMIGVYELVKQKKHGGFKFASEVFEFYRIPKQNFFKLYHRFKQVGTDRSLLPLKRGRKFGTIQTMPMIQHKIQELRNQGFGRYEIYDLMLPQYGRFTPSPSTIYRILKTYGINNVSKAMLRHKRKIIKEKAGEMGHMDCHQVRRGTVEGINKRLYLVGLIDDFSRLCAVEVVSEAKSLTVGLSTIKLLSMIYQNYGIKFEDMLTDNGSEFKGEYHTILEMLHIKQRYTQPYRPQTNGKMERFWKTIECELLAEQTYSSIDELKEQIFNYMIYYNHLRYHQGIQRKPIQSLLVSSSKL